MNRGLYLGIGFVVWLAATLALRLAGHVFFLPDNAVVMVVLYGLALGAVVGIALGVFRWRRLRPEQRPLAVILLALPGMLLDVLSVQFFAAVFPNMPLAANAPFGAWLLWAYAGVLLAAFMPVRSAGG